MFDEMQRLREGKDLYRLLAHYIQRGNSDREAWLDRVMELADVAPRDLVKLHGELIAHGWLEQNTGVTPVVKPEGVPCCYRATPAGLRALKNAGPPADEVDAA
jgi:hypothetical protein